MADLGSIRTILKTYDQEHLLAWFEELDSSQQSILLAQLDALDFPQIQSWIEQYVLQKPTLEIPTNIQPPQIIPFGGGDNAEAARAQGQELLRAGKVAAFVVAGGQGTRLGFEGPKGCYPATPVTEKPLFRVFAEQINAAQQTYGVSIPWYILTSPINDTATQAHFRQNNFWGLDPANVKFIPQGTLPAVGYDGKLLLGRKYRLAVNPNGHGGSLTALAESGALADMAERGIDYISYFQVDNPLVRVLDPVFLGLVALGDAEAAAKSLSKRDPYEKLGNFCVVDDKTTIIEYSDLPAELAEACNPDGRLKFSAGSIAIHIFRRDFVERITAGGTCLLPIHRADKKVPHIDPATGKRVSPDAPNAVKLELFVFDAMPLAEKTVIYSTSRGEEFSPIKNAEGEDSPATSKHDQVRRYANWLEAAGVAIPRDAMGQIAAAIEISPLFADSPEMLKASLATLPEPLNIHAGDNVYLGSRGQISGK
ncbi:MAG: UDPGP type 1 family protein [Phycisphaerales bacterium]|jgi:UDP-N-acetylglucosamine/UDP-N-acetylgalactosamine diphosphorylase|nr:UDPGP type 1 family protein [Phycisphaerales bacterium]MBT7170899.1 UDPGP type 1 family protein [Phycisphaerales bacterium]